MDRHRESTSVEEEAADSVPDLMSSGPPGTVRSAPNKMKKMVSFGRASEFQVPNLAQLAPEVPPPPDLDDDDGLEIRGSNASETSLDDIQWRTNPLTRQDVKSVASSLSRTSSDTFSSDPKRRTTRLMSRWQSLKKSSSWKESSEHLVENSEQGLDKQGWLMKEEKNGKWKTYWYAVKGNNFLQCTGSEDKHIQKPKSSVSLDTPNIRLMLSRGGNQVFMQLIINDVRERFQADDESDLADWMMRLTNRISLLAYRRSGGSNPSITNFLCRPRDELALNDTPLSTNDLTVLSMPLTYHTYLRHLSFERAELGNLEMQLLSRAASGMSSLETLELSGNNVEPDGATALARALATCKDLTSLSLANNKIGDSGVEALSEAMETHESLTLLDLTANGITGDGAASLAGAIAAMSPKMFPKILLSGNQIGDQGACHIWSVCTTNPSVTCIDVSDNRIGDDGMKDFASCLKGNNTVSELDLSNNRLGKDGISVLAEVWEECNIQRLELGGNRFDEASLACLGKCKLGVEALEITCRERELSNSVM